MNIMRLMLTMLVAGLITVGAGLYLLFFTETAEQNGVQGLTVIVILISVGLLLLIPAKVYLILQLTNRERRKLKNKNSATKRAE